MKLTHFRLFQTERACKKQEWGGGGGILVLSSDVQRARCAVMMKLKLLKTARLFNHFRNKPLPLHVCCTSLLKTLRENERLLLTSIFSCSHSVFNPFGELSSVLIKFANSFSLEESKICHLVKS